jgi:hypothetical protein
MGQNSRLQSLTGDELALELARAGVEPAVQAAIVQQRPRQLEELIGASHNVCCLVHAPQDDEPDEQQPEDDKRIHLSAHPSDLDGADLRVARAN